ncbi:MAG: hypothetical protein ACRD26_00910 [Vicinamibacterales bacterium]
MISKGTNVVAELRGRRCRGGTAYRDRYRHELERHVLALESDTGVFSPAGFGFTGTDRARA